MKVINAMKPSHIKELEALMQPPINPPLSTVNWDMASEMVGVCFPDDFKQFISAYGNAIWCDSFLPVYPGDDADGIKDYEELCHELLAQMDYIHDGTKELSFKLSAEQGGLWPCLRDFDGGHVCWIIDGDPNDWGVIRWWSTGSCAVFQDRNVTQLIHDWMKQVPDTANVWRASRLNSSDFGLHW